MATHGFALCCPRSRTSSSADLDGLFWWEANVGEQGGSHLVLAYATGRHANEHAASWQLRRAQRRTSMS